MSPSQTDGGRTAYLAAEGFAATMDSSANRAKRAVEHRYQSVTTNYCVPQVASSKVGREGFRRVGGVCGGCGTVNLLSFHRVYLLAHRR